MQKVKVDAPVPLIFPKIKCFYSQGVGKRIDPGPKVLLVVPYILYMMYIFIFISLIWTSGFILSMHVF